MKTTFLVLAALAACAAIATASSTQIWEQKTIEDFEKGEASGVSIGSEGRLQLSPPLDLAFDTGDPYAWALARDSRGRVFVAGGNEGKVYVFTPGASDQRNLGAGSLFFKAREIEVHALAVDSADNVYVGSSPDGKVYRVAADGNSSIFFEPKARYIWALAFDRRGNLYVATGDRGELFKVDPQGRGSVIYKSGDKHMRALSPYGDGVVVGTEGQGRIVRVSAEGQAFVLYDAPVREITSVVVVEDGTVYAAGIGAVAAGPQPIGQPPPRPMPAPSSDVPISVGGTLQFLTDRPGLAGTQFAREAQNSEVYRIAPDGYPRRIWKPDRITAFSVAAASDGSALVGTGDRGMIYKVHPDSRAASVLVRTGGSQVTALLADGRTGTVYAATSNLGRLYRVGSGYAGQGSYESQVKDAGIFSKWGRLRWREDVPKGTSVKVFTRSGNTREPDSTWSPWSQPLTQASGQQVTSPQARFFQWKLVLDSMNKGVTPLVDNVELAYLPRNVSPEINWVVLQQKDLAIERLPTLQDQQFAPQLFQLTQYPQNLPGGSTSSQPQISIPPRPIQSRTSIKKGWQSVTWDARDDNGDTLLSAVYMKGEGETEWKLLKDHIEESFFSWDTTNFPDGAYTLKLVVSDSPSNPGDLALQTSRISERFYIDNTAPTISALSVVPAGSGRVRVRLHAADTATWLNKAEYGVDGGEPRQVFPADGLFDSEAEDFDFTVNGLGPGEHTIVVKIADRANNQASAKQVVSIR